MSYIKAEAVLPEKLIQEIQKYVNGENIYIPAVGKQKDWGEKSGYREELKKRNQQIKKLYLQGLAVEEIACRFYLSEKSIYRILDQNRRKSCC